MTKNMLWALGWTILIEEVLLCFGFRKKELWRVVLFNNLLTNPALNFLLLVCGGSFSSVGLELVAEGVVVLIEGRLLQYFSCLGRKRALWISLMLNLGSYLAGKG